MGAFDQLLTLQDQDTLADQLRHRRANLAERAELARLTTDLQAHDAVTAVVEAKRTALRRDQHRIEDEVASVETKAADADRTLYSGTVTSPRELKAFQDDLESLRRRQKQLEDQVIELMEQIEPLDEQIGRRGEERSDIEQRVSEVRAALQAREHELETELGEVLAQRDDIASKVEPDLLRRYDQLRTELGGIAVAPLVGSSCGGCHLTLSAMELDRIRSGPADTLVYCEECGRLLVR
jgi:uncharacterized protein